MKIFKDIDIAEPIWKTKSVGLAVDDVPQGQNVKVTISYISRTTGKQTYPGEYIVEVDKIRSYPVQVVRRVNVHIVPIADLAKLTVFNNQIQNNMLFSSNDLGTIIQQSEEAKKKGEGFENKELIVPGKHLLTVKDVTLQQAKSDNSPMIVVEFELDEKHRTIKEFMKISGAGSDIPRQKLVKLFHRGFNYAIQPCNTEADLMNQLIKFKDKKLTVVVNGERKAYSFQDKDGKDIVMEQIYPNFWYCGTTAEFDEVTFDESKLVKDLSDEDKERLVKFAEINGGPYIPKSQTNTASPVQTTQPETTASAQVAQPAQTAVASAPATPAPQPIEEVPSKPVQESVAESPAPVQPDNISGTTAIPETETPTDPAANAPAADDDFPF